MKMIEIKAKDLKQGEEFRYGGREFVALGLEQNGILAVSKQTIGKKSFDKNDSNDWRHSSLREYLNGEFIEKEFDPSGLLEFTSDLTAEDGLNDYGKSVDLVFLLSVDLYRKYRLFMPKWSAWVWFITPWSCLSCYDAIVYGAYTDGTLSCCCASYDFDVAVACLINPESSVSVGEIIKGD